jgi:hypothetical protein
MLPLLRVDVLDAQAIGRDIANCRNWLRHSKRFCQMPTGPQLTIWCADIAMAFYFVAIAQMLRIRHAEWTDNSRTRLARWIWSADCVTYWFHWLLAFHYFHHWSHAEAVAHTRMRSGFGYGILFSHVFTVIWTADAVWWWRMPASYLNRPRWLGAVIHGYMFFVVFQSTAVFGTGLVRWGALVASVLLLVIGEHTRLRNKDGQQKSPADSERTGRAT